MPVSHTLLMYLDVILVFLQVNTLRGVQKVKFLLTRESDHCSCPLISRQGGYLKLTLPADVDILAESDNPTHCADGFHCNVRSPLQDYAMPFLHSVSAWTRCSLPSSFSRTFLQFHYSEDCWLPLCRAPDSTLWRTAVFHALYTLNRYLSATGWTVPVLYRQSVFLSLLTWHPALSLYRNLPCLRPSLWLHDRNSPGRFIWANPCS